MQKTGCNIKAVLFDFDGTLTRPGAIEFKIIKKALGCPTDQPVLEYIETMATERDRRDAMRRLNQFEAAAAANSRPNDGAQEIILWLKQKTIPMGILTRNSRQSVMRALENFDAIDAGDFEVMITRDDPLPPKPSGVGVLHAAERWGVKPRQLLMVGDYLFDPMAGRQAGATTVLLDPFEDQRLRGVDCDFRIRHLRQLRAIILNGVTCDVSMGDGAALS
jgi:hydrogenase expression/formation protein HypE